MDRKEDVMTYGRDRHVQSRGRVVRKNANPADVIYVAVDADDGGPLDAELKEDDAEAYARASGRSFVAVYDLRKKKDETK